MNMLQYQFALSQKVIMSYEFSPLQLIFGQKPNSATSMNCSTIIHKDDLERRLEIYVECESLCLILGEKISSWKEDQLK